MLTPRGWWLLVLLGVMLLLALALSVTGLTLVATTLLAWFLFEWLRFSWQTRHLATRLTVWREVRAGTTPMTVLWARRPLTVHVILQNEGGALPFLRVVDRVPSLVRWLEGDPWTRGPLPAEGSLAIEYRIEPRAAGRAVFDGLQVTAADLQGFFFRTVFVRNRSAYRVLPPLHDAHPPSRRKRMNQLPLLGTHRLRRPGSGSELLDLRDYLPSDPPKLIAWKPSARRDRLITRELESDVPIRCTLLLDVSSSVRVGPVGDNALARLVEIAAAVLHVNHEARDLTGLTLVDEEGIGRAIRPARGRRAFYETLNLLADVADLAPTLGGSLALIPTALGLAQDLYPERLDPEMNGTPLLWPGFWWNSNRQRKRVAALLAHHYRLGPGGIGLLYHDDDRFREMQQLWLADHRVSVPTLLYDDAGRYRFRFPHKPALFARALLNGVSRGKDNEVFVLLADLFDLGGELEPLVRAAKVAAARHHHVQLVCPWPPGVPLPGEAIEPPAALPPVQQLLNRAWTARLQLAYDALRRTFVRAGVDVIPAPHESVVPAILQRLHRVRLGGRR